MATGDRLVCLDGLKAAYDDLNAKNSDLQSAVGDALAISHNFDVTWEMGGYANNGTPNSNTNRIRTPYFEKPLGVASMYVTVASGYNVNILGYATNGNIYPSNWMGSGSITLDGYVGWKIACKRVPDSSDTMSTAEGANITITYSTALLDKIDKPFLFRGYLNNLGITAVKDLMTNAGWYGFGSAYASSITDLPTNYSNAAGTIEILKPAFANSGFGISRLYDNAGNMWSCVWQNKTKVGDWVLEYGPLKDANGNYTALAGKNVVILGDSICTNGDYSAQNPTGNMPEIVIQSEDVGVELKAYATYYDVGTTVGGHEITSSDIGTELTFTPVAGDVGKIVGKSLTFNESSLKTWWEVAADALGFNPIPVCWSGSSITSHEASDSKYATSYAWHDAQIRKCGIRTPGTSGLDSNGKINRSEPDLIIIHRGGNDFSHESYAKLTTNYFNNPDWDYPASDTVTGGYGFKEGYALTIKKLREAYPNAKIFLSTINMMKRVDYDNFPPTNGTDSLPMYNNAIREIADFFGCGVIEFDKDGITFENCRSQGYLVEDSGMPTHPTTKGHKVMGLKAIADLKAQYSPMS